MNLFFDFSAALGLATIVTGAIWALDTMFFKKGRIAKKQSLIDQYQLVDLDAKKISPEDLDAAITASQTDPMMVEPAPRMSKLADYSKSFFPVLLLVFLLRAFIAEPFRIPSGSMRPGLVEGDFILVNKFVYGLKLPLTGTKLLKTGKPHRGDVLVFRSPEDTSIDYIKRVVGLPGDKVKVKDKVVYINGEAVNLEYIETSYDTDISGIARKVKHYKEKLNSNKHSIFVSPYAQGDYEETIVPQGHYFVMGDNRDMSRDSRIWGFVPEKLVLGKAFFIWLSFDMTKKDVRWSRVGFIGKQES